MYNLKFDLALLGEENVVYKDVNIDFNGECLFNGKQILSVKPAAANLPFTKC